MKAMSGPAALQSAGRIASACAALGALGALGAATLTASAAGPIKTSWRYYRVGNTGIQGDYNEAIWIGPDGDPYIAGYDASFEEGGFAKFIQSENRWVNYSNVDYRVMGHPNDQGCIRIGDIAAESGGKLWMGTWRGALTFDPARGASSLARYGPLNSGLTDDRVEDIDRAPDGSMWFANNGSARFDPATGTWTRFEGLGNSFLSVQPKPSGGYLVWSSNRPPYQDFTYIFDSDTQRWRIIDVQVGFNEPDVVVGMPGKDCVDDAGNFWALRSTTPGGYDSLDYRTMNGAWVTPPEPYGSITFDLWAFKAYGAGRAVMVDGSGVVYDFDGVRWNNLGTWRPGAFTYAVDIDAEGNVWVSGVGGAARRDAQTGQWQRYRITNTGNFDTFNRDLTIDTATGAMYTGANAGPGIGGMVRFDGTRWTGWNQATYGLGYDWPFPNDWCQALAYRPSTGGVAVSPLNWMYGIHEWTGSGFKALLPGGGAQRMCEDSLGRLWALGEYYSLRFYDGTTWKDVPNIGWGANLRPDPTRVGTVWAMTQYEFLRTDGGSYNFSRTIADFRELTDNSDFFSGFAADKNGIVWVGCTVNRGVGGTGGGLIRMDANSGSYQMLRFDRGWPFPGHFVTPWAVTPDGRLWLQYDSEYPFTERGLCWWDGEKVGAFPAPIDGGPQWGSLPHGQVEDVEVKVTTDGYELWMSCVSRGIAVLKVQTQPTKAKAK